MIKIGILGWDYEEHESLHLEALARRSGMVPLLFTLDDVRAVEREGHFDVLVRGVHADDLDVIVSRAQLRVERWQSDLEKLTLLSNLDGIPILDPADTFVAAESKLIGLQKLSQAGLRVPPSMLCTSLDEIRQAWSRWGRIVLKPSFGYAGTDVERVDDDFKGSSDVMRRLLGQYGEVIVQQFMPHPQGDIRVNVVGDDVTESFRRIPPPGKWKANVAMGARVAPYEPSARVREIALTAARAMGITIAGLDIIEYQGEYVILEINNVPGWYASDQDVQDEIAGKILGYAVQRAQRAARKGWAGSQVASL